VSILIIEVTQQDIDAGQRFDCEACPIALALRRAGFADAEVGHSAAWRTPDEQWEHQTTRLPYEAQNFIKRFDTLQAVEPFKFDIPWELGETKK
jgi:hypothetical protein